MSKVVSAGLLVYRWRAVPEEPNAADPEGRRLEVLLVHPGGPYFARKELGIWSIPKGQVDPGEDRLAAARRECREETGYEPEGPFVSLGGVKYKNHKVVYAWAVEGDFDPRDLVSITFELVWPPRSGKVIEAPEVDRAAWFGLESARAAILPPQRRFLDDLEAIVGAAPGRRAAPEDDAPGGGEEAGGEGEGAGQVAGENAGGAAAAL